MSQGRQRGSGLGPDPGVDAEVVGERGVVLVESTDEVDPHAEFAGKALQLWF